MELRRYSGSMLRVRGAVIPGARRLSRVAKEPSREAKGRLKWIDWYQQHGKNARKTCRHFGLSPDTFYRWLRRYDPRDLNTLESLGHRPRRVRQPTWSPQMAQAVLKLSEEYPRWGKDKLAVLLRQQGIELSTSMVGRILGSLKARGVLKEPPRNGISARRRQYPRPYAVRKPKEYQAQEPGDLVEVDTLDVRPVPGVVLKHFTARDVISRWDILEVHTKATANTATAFLDTLQARLPFPIKAIQVDGGSEFQASFEEACRQRALRLYVLPPRSPKLNGHVERAQRTHTEEFYELYDGDLKTSVLNLALREWERVYNEVRPHQALAYRTPAQYLQQWRQAQPRAERTPGTVAVSGKSGSGRGEPP